MDIKVFYGTVTDAIAALRQKGFTVDFNLQENCIVCHPEKFYAGDFEIMETWRYEGNTDPADQATVYGIESKSGLKGILVAGYGISSDVLSDAIVRKLKFHS